eukprot:1160634-Pelagomonas_calceolata.AAC.8
MRQTSYWDKCLHIPPRTKYLRILFWAQSCTCAHAKEKLNMGPLQTFHLRKDSRAAEPSLPGLTASTHGKLLGALRTASALFNGCITLTSCGAR